MQNNNLRNETLIPRMKEKARVTSAELQEICPRRGKTVTCLVNRVSDISGKKILHRVVTGQTLKVLLLKMTVKQIA